jgi:hypothetical protein
LSAAICAAIGFLPEGLGRDSAQVEFPTEIEGLELDFLLRLVKFLASTDPVPVSRDDAERTDLKTAVKVADAAARVLEDWPHKLWRNLEHRIPTTVSRCVDLSPRIVFGPLYWRMVRDLPRDAFKFLHEAIDRFVFERWKGPIYGGKGHFSASTNGHLKWYTLAQAKRIAHKDPKAMKELIASGVVRSELIHDGAGNEKVYVHRESLDELIKSGQPYFSYSDIRQHLGLTNPQVLQLAKAGVIRCLGSREMRTSGFAKNKRYPREDVLAIERSFASNLVRGSDSMTCRTGPVTSIGEALAFGYIDSEYGLPTLIRAVIENRLRPITQVTNAQGILGYTFGTDDLAPFKHTWTVSVAVPDGYMNYGEAADLIGTDRKVIGKLVLAGYLDAAGLHSRSKLLHSAEVHRFAAKYVSLAAATKMLNMNARSIVSFLESSSTSFLIVPMYSYQKPALFVPRRACVGALKMV